MRLTFASLFLFLAGSALAQMLPGNRFQPLGQVKQYLQLTDAQLQTILSNNDQYNRWSSERQNRIQQVRNEIADETAREPLDPNGLGIRYAEIEAICREMKERANEYRTRNMNVFNGAQKAKLTVLEEAMKLAPVISEAQNGNLLGNITSAPYAFTSSSMGIGGSVVGAIIGPANGCSVPFPIPTSLRPALSSATANRWLVTTGAVDHSAAPDASANQK